MTPEVQFEPGWLAEEFRHAREEIASWPKTLRDQTPVARWKKEHTEKSAMLTPEDRMREAILAARKESDEAFQRNERGGALAFDSYLTKHGTAAIRAAVEEERAKIVAWLLSKGDDIVPRRHVAELIQLRDPEAWAARTGWRAP